MTRSTWGRRLFATVLALTLVGLIACSDDDASPRVDDVDETLEPIPEEYLPVPLPDEDPSGSIEDGRIAFHGWDDGTSRQLWVTDPASGEPVELAVAGYEGVIGPSVSPDGETIAALAWLPDHYENSSTVLVGTLDGGLEPLYSNDDLDMWCLRWYPSGDRLLLTSFVEDEVDPMLLAIDLDGEATEIDVPPGRFECAIPLGDDRMAMNYIGEGIGFVGTAIVDLASTDEVAEVLFQKVGCLIYGGTLSPDASAFVTAASCEIPADSGVHVIDLASGEVEHLVVAEVAFPSFSPSGEWVTFGLFPDPEARTSTIYAVQRDGSGFRQLTQVGGTQPVWVR